MNRGDIGGFLEFLVSRIISRIQRIDFVSSFKAIDDLRFVFNPFFDFDIQMEQHSMKASDILDCVHLLIKKALSPHKWLSEIALEKNYETECIILNLAGLTYFNVAESIDNVTNGSSNNADSYSNAHCEFLDDYVSIKEECADLNVPYVEMESIDEDLLISGTDLKPDGGIEALDIPLEDAGDSLNLQPPIKKKACKISTKLSVETKKRIKAKSISKERKGRTRVTCPHCEYQTDSNYKLERHRIVRHTDQKPYQCDQCNYKTKTADCLRSHMQARHSSDEKMYQCKECDYSGKNKLNLDRHMRIHSEGTYACHFCKYKARSSQRLRDHENQMHLVTSLFECELCNFKTITKTRFDEHVLSHKTNIFFGCDVCGKRFSVRNDYLHHKKLHQKSSNVKKFSCIFCGEKFEAYRDRKLHLSKYHNFEGYECRLCGSVFSHVGSFSKHHKKNHPNEDMYNCYLCNFSSNDGREYRKHLLLPSHLSNVSRESNILMSQNSAQDMD